MNEEIVAMKQVWFLFVKENMVFDTIGFVVLSMVYCVKYKADGTIDICKVHLVACKRLLVLLTRFPL